ncbi:hypothetical protein EDB86DRAFT_2947945 [Lactarius hatsudake]|nr:hypothetical protein EDB86DRAFT_2955054 [Lactarius hatsudake]KAH8988177.1 hypothetical protein EDB86DRAFT_2947945 [Lactarius hatsudake]
MKPIFHILFFAWALGALASPSSIVNRDVPPDNIVYITDAKTHCIIVPRTPHTNVGDSEHPGGMKTYCTPAGRLDSSQGQLPADFWRDIEFKNGTGMNGGRFAQVTGCINSSHLSRLNPNDAGGQYDSSGGVGGMGNPQGSICLNYNHYVEILEPAGPRACLKCCDDPADCPTNKDTQGCPNVIEGNYFNCD